MKMNKKYSSRVFYKQYYLSHILYYIILLFNFLYSFHSSVNPPIIHLLTDENMPQLESHITFTEKRKGKIKYPKIKQFHYPSSVPQKKKKIVKF